MQELVIEDIIEYLGYSYTKKSGNHYLFKCPKCEDSHGDNLDFTEDSQGSVLTCFANSDHSKEIYGKIMSKNGYKEPRKTKIETTKPFKPIDLGDKWWNYITECNQKLLNNPRALKYLYKKRGLSENSVTAFMIGIDENKILPRAIDKGCYTFPIFYNGNLVDVEFRFKDLLSGGAKIVSRLSSKDKGHEETVACLSDISLGIDPKYLIILEGFIDAYSFYEFLIYEKMGASDWHVKSVSNGVHMCANQINTINHTKYEEIYLMLDNDKVGKEETEKTIKRACFPIEVMPVPDNCNDFNEYWLKVINNEV